MSTGDKIVLAMGEAGFSMLSVSEIAARAKVARGTVYSHIDPLIAAGLLQRTSLSGNYALSGPGHRHAEQLRTT